MKTGWELAEELFGEDVDFSEIPDLDDVEDYEEDIDYNEGWYNYYQATFKFKGKKYGFELKSHTSDNVCDIEIYEDTFKEIEETVTISKEEYERLLRESEFLNCLEACGVDNWVGYSDAWEMTGEEE